MTPKQRRDRKAFLARLRTVRVILDRLPKPDSNRSRRNEFVAKATRLRGAMDSVQAELAVGQAMETCPPACPRCAGTECARHGATPCGCSLVERHNNAPQTTTA